MSLSTNVSNLATRIATEVKALRTLVNGNVADLSSLTTTEKSNLVAAINELKNFNDTTSTIILGLEDSINTVDGKVGTLSSLTTTAKSNLVAAINELQTEINTIDLSALINDSTTTTSTTWSSSKINTEIGSAVSALVAGAPALLDTLNELAAAIGDDANYAATMTTALGNKQDKVTGVSDTEIGYLSNVTSDIQDQISGKVDMLPGADSFSQNGDVLTYSAINGGWGPSSFNSTVNLPSNTSIANVTGTEISYLEGVTSSIQTQLNAKASAANVGDTTVNYVTTFEAGLV